MKKTYQLIIFFFIILSFYFFYKQYFVGDTNKIKYSQNSKTQILENELDNIIKDLKYEIQIDSNRRYVVKSKSSKIINSSIDELIEMNNVEAILFNAKKISLKINSDQAIYNNINYNTNFFGNLKISYEDHLIFADKLDFDFQSNEILISGNVRYIGYKSSMKSDKIKINIVSKKIDVFMNNNNDNIKIIQTK
jgi:hypothetical protein